MRKNIKLFYLVDAARLTAVLIYTVFYLFAKDFLSAKLFIDSDKIFELRENTDVVDNSFAATAYVFSFFSLNALNFLVWSVGVFYIYFLTKKINKIKTFIILGIVFFPTMIFNLMVPSKETLVVVLSLCIVFLYHSGVKIFYLISAAIFLYFFYGLFVRNYYLLIVFLSLGIYLWRGLSGGGRIILMFLIFVVIFIIPADVFQTLQGQRDSSNDYAAYIAGSVNRTAFYNLLPPVNAVNFIANYIYAFIVLNFPFVLFFSLNEIVLFFNTSVYLLAIFLPIRFVASSGSYVNSLLLAHLLVLVLFEPDLGSYLRHLSSVSLYLIPSILVQDNRGGLFGWKIKF